MATSPSPTNREDYLGLFGRSARSPVSLFATLKVAEPETPMPQVFNSQSTSNDSQPVRSGPFQNRATSIFGSHVSPTAPPDHKMPVKRAAHDILDSTPVPKSQSEGLGLVSLLPNPKKKKNSELSRSDSLGSQPLSQSDAGLLEPFRKLKNIILRPLSQEAKEKNPPDTPNPFVSLCLSVTNPTTKLLSQLKSRGNCSLGGPHGFPGYEKSTFLGGSQLPHQIYTKDGALSTEPADLAPSFTLLPELSSKDVGGCVVFSTDDFYGPSSQMLESSKPVYKRHEFSSVGRCVDGWETQRRLRPLHDWCIVQLGAPGKLYGCEIDTTHFDGNQAPFISIEAAYAPALQEKIRECYSKEDLPVPDFASVGVAQPDAIVERVNRVIQEQSLKDASQWRDIVPMSPLKFGDPDSKDAPTRQYFKMLENPLPMVTHLRLNLFPDGGLARFRVFGVAVPEPIDSKEPPLSLISSIQNGGVIVSASGGSMTNPHCLIKENIPPNIGDCWETRRQRHRRPCVEILLDTQRPRHLTGEEWVVLRLGRRSKLRQIDIDTRHCLGNTPESLMIRGVDVTEGCVSCFNDILAQRELFSEAEVLTGLSSTPKQPQKLELRWKLVVSNTPLHRQSVHTFCAGPSISYPAQGLDSRSKRKPRRKTGSTPQRQGCFERETYESEGPNFNSYSQDSDARLVHENHELENSTDLFTHLCITIFPQPLDNLFHGFSPQALARIRVWGYPA